MKYMLDASTLMFYIPITKKALKLPNKKKQYKAREASEQKAKLLNLKDISKKYSIPLSTLRRWASERKFPLYKISNRILVSIEEFDNWLSNFRVDLQKH